MNPHLLARGFGLMKSDDTRYDATGYREDASAGWGTDAFYSGGVGPLGSGGALVIQNPFNPFGATARSRTEAQGGYPTQSSTPQSNGSATQPNAQTGNSNSLIALAAIAALLLLLKN